MKINRNISRPNTQKKYRLCQASKGFVRFELQVQKDTKLRFDKLVDAAAEDFVAPWSKKQRIAKARAKIFDDITKNVIHEFHTLQSQIESLKAEIKALSPAVFNLNGSNIPLPAAINELPNDPKHLKQLLAKTHLQFQQANKAQREFKQQSEQYLALYEAASKYNDELSAQLPDDEVL